MQYFSVIIMFHRKIISNTSCPSGISFGIHSFCVEFYGKWLCLAAINKVEHLSTKQKIRKLVSYDGTFRHYFTRKKK